MMCPDCKTQNFSFAEYCRKCQKQLTRKSYEQLEQERQNRRGLFSVGLVK